MSISNSVRRGLLGLALLAAATAITLRSLPTAGEEAASKLPRRVLVSEAASAKGQGSMQFSGVTRAQKRARLAFTVGGRLESRPVRLGDRVDEGAILARLEDQELEHAVEAARAQWRELLARSEQSERDRKRVEQLVEAEAATTEELEAVRAGATALAANVERARVGLEEAERRLREATLRAPFAGTVVEVMAEPGEHVAPGRTLVALQGVGGLEVEIEVPEGLLAELSVGEEVGVQLPARGQEVAGKIGFLSRAASGPGRLFPVVVSLEEADLGLPGSTAEVRIARRHAAVVTVPVEAVVDPGGERPSVFRVRDGVAEKVAVELGDLMGSRVQVVGSIEIGDLVVVAGQRGLLSGDAVEIAR